MSPTYNTEVETLRESEYPSLLGKVYLDHGGTTIYAKSLIEEVAKDLTSHLYGNPHSDSSPSRLSSSRVSEVRQRTLQFFNADPDEFDLIFTANATASIKLVMDSFRDLAASSAGGQFWYCYHRDAHTSLVGVRETTNGCQRCFQNDEEVEAWLDSASQGNDSDGLVGSRLGLFAYPGQSNMTGRRLPLTWPAKLRRSSRGDSTYSLLDAAALATTSPLDFRNVDAAPDFTALSFYKIFGYPDLGGLIVRKNSGHILQWRKYFGGGTVDMVVCLRDAWHAPKDYTTDDHYSLHDRLEDGTLPFHSIIALGKALDVHARLFGSMQRISQHTAYLVKRMYDSLSGMEHGNGRHLCRLYVEPTATPGDPKTQGATIAFNVQRPDGSLVPYSEVERAADAKGIYVRSGGLCNPGGIASHLKLEPWEMKRAFSAGHRCGHATEIISGKPTGVVRASLGAMSTRADVDTLIRFLGSFVEGLGGSEQPIKRVPTAASDSIPARGPLRFEREEIKRIVPVKSLDHRAGVARLPSLLPQVTEIEIESEAPVPVPVPAKRRLRRVKIWRRILPVRSNVDVGTRSGCNERESIRAL